MALLLFQESTCAESMRPFVSRYTLSPRRYYGTVCFNSESILSEQMPRPILPILTAQSISSTPWNVISKRSERNNVEPVIRNCMEARCFTIITWRAICTTSLLSAAWLGLELRFAERGGRCDAASSLIAGTYIAVSQATRDPGADLKRATYVIESICTSLNLGVMPRHDTTVQCVDMSMWWDLTISDYESWRNA